MRPYLSFYPLLLLHQVIYACKVSAVVFARHKYLLFTVNDKEICYGFLSGVATLTLRVRHLYFFMIKYLSLNFR